MSDETLAPKSRNAAETGAPDTSVETAAPADAATAAPGRSPQSAHAEPATVPAAATGEVAPAPATGGVAPAESPVAGQQVVYVQAPLPPRVRGNRVVGVLLALVGTVVFAVVYAGAASIPLAIRFSGAGFNPAFSAFVQNAIFWIPIMMFALGFIVLTVILNRAGWWAHVLGSVLVALFVYFASIGLLLLVGNVVSMTPAQANSAFGALATNPLMIAAALVAREVSIWIGLGIAARGRRVRARNVETRAAWDREQEEKRAEYERTGAAPAA
ncbi:MAG TPA: hypothetical protein VFQ74_03270 [Pseudolysinimonas sp.]|nr:hypothetical protein [Pseudolysinimonas sp.]